MSYTAETFHIAGAVAACMRLEQQGEACADYYLPCDDWPVGLSWHVFAQLLWMNTNEDVLSVDTLREAPYRVMIGNRESSDAVGWIDVTAEDDALGAQPDYVTDYLNS